jgi:N-acetyltransferase
MVKLVPMERTHFEDLLKVGTEEEIWEFISINGAEKQTLLRLLESAVLKRATGEQYPFTILDRKTGNVIGSTMFHSIFPENRKLEIGWTWYASMYWRTGYNRECKLLLLSYCFEVLKTIRVQFVTDENNARSRAAILGIGATFEGILRNERIRSNGAYRNTVVYSIVEEEWEDVKNVLLSKIK